MLYIYIVHFSSCGAILSLIAYHLITISFTKDMLGWTPNKGKPITGQTGHPRVYLHNQRLGELDKLSHNAHNPDRLSQGAMQNTLDKGAAKAQILGQAELH